MTLLQKRKADLHRRLTAGAGAPRKCAFIWCPHPTTASAGSGLNHLYCKSHEDHRERHGSHLKRSYSGPHLAPYRAEARKTLQDNATDPTVKRARRGIEVLYASAGATVEAFRLRGLSPQDRARATWARLRQSEVDPVEALAAWLAVKAIIRDDIQPDSRNEFRIVQVGKLIHRLAGGSHRRWVRERSGGQIEVIEMHRHPASRGRVLRYVGEQLELAAECLGPYVGESL